MMITPTLSPSAIPPLEKRVYRRNGVKEYIVWEVMSDRLLRQSP